MGNLRCVACAPPPPPPPLLRAALSVCDAKAGQQKSNNYLLLLVAAVIHSPRASPAAMLSGGGGQGEPLPRASALRRSASSLPPSCPAAPSLRSGDAAVLSMSLDPADSLGQERFGSEWQLVEELHCPLVAVGSGGEGDGDGGATAATAAAGAAPFRPKYSGLIGTIRTVAAEEGAASLWKGLVPSMHRQVLYGGER